MQLAAWRHGVMQAPTTKRAHNQSLTCHRPTSNASTRSTKTTTAASTWQHTHRARCRALRCRQTAATKTAAAAAAALLLLRCSRRLRLLLLLCHQQLLLHGEAGVVACCCSARCTNTTTTAQPTTATT
jgi:hypothetical protein